MERDLSGPPETERLTMTNKRRSARALAGRYRTVATALPERRRDPFGGRFTTAVL